MHLILISVIFLLFYIAVSFNFEGSGDDESFNLSNEELMPLTKTKSINSVLAKEKARKNISKPIRNITINLKKKSGYHRSNARYYDLCRHARCGHNCHLNNNNVQCSCRKGFELHADGKSCKDIDECQHFNGGCEQLCVNNVGSYYCECREHYRLRENSKVSCEAFCSPPCLNNGECIGPNMCSCPPGYLLPRCSPICNPPCANGGICKRHNICKCPENYSGPTCLIALCKSNCLNGGRCIAPNICQCPSNYFGETCQKALCTPACENGGTCVAINQCICKPGFKGLRCQAEIAFSETGPCKPPCTALQTSLAEASHPTLRNCRPPCQNGHRCTLGNKCICRNGASSTKCQHRHCPIVTFTSKVTRMVRIRVTETFLSDCNTSLKQKCINYRLVEKMIPKTFYKLGYKLRCS